MKSKSCFRVGLCMLTLGITIGYIITKLIDKLDYHFICIGKDHSHPKHFGHGCCDEDEMDDPCVPAHDCNEDTNEPEPYTEEM